MIACACFSVNWKARDQRFARFLRRFRRANQPDHFVQVIQRLLEAEQNVLAIPRLAQFVLGPPPHHFDPVIDEVLEHVDQPEFARLPVDDREHDDAEPDLQLRVLVQVVENHLGLLAALQFEDDPHAVAIALVANVADAFQLLLVDQRARRFDQPRLCSPGTESRVTMICSRSLPIFSIAALARSFNWPRPADEGVQDPLPPQNEAARREVRTLHEFHDLRQVAPSDAGSGESWR